MKRGSIAISLSLAAFLISGCAEHTETIHLSKGTERVTCGPYTWLGGIGEAERVSLRECVADFQRQGYQRVQ